MTFRVIAGPCAVESEEQIDRLAAKVASTGVRWLRAGAWKPRTSATSFQGLGRLGCEYAARAARRHDLKLVTEVLDVRDAEWAAQHIDVAQIGARNMHNVPLLREVARSFDAILLKRSNSATLDEWSGAVGYVLEQNPNVRLIVCERGLRGFDPSLRNQLDLAGALLMKLRHPDLEVFVDPSHATGRAELVRPLVRAVKAAGLDGALIEVHDAPTDALCDGEQAIDLETLTAIVSEVGA